MAAPPLHELELPAGVAHVRTTPTFDAATVPPGLLRAHQVAEGVWGVLRVLAGTVTFVLEATGDRRTLRAGDHQVIQPLALHHVEPGPDARFEVEFHR